MTRPSLQQLFVSTPLRLTGVLIAVFVAVLLTSFSVSFIVIRNSFDVSLRATLTARVAEYQAITDAADLKERLISDIAMSDPSLTILKFEPYQGLPLSNVDRFPRVEGTQTVSEKQISGRRIDDSYLALSSAVVGGRLTVALTRGQLVDMGEVFASVLVISLMPTLAIAAALGLFFARAVRRRIEAISTTLQQLRAGNLHARVALMDGTRDDLAVIGSAVNDMAAAQEAAMSGLKQVTADIAHDLKTPIQRVALTLDRLASSTDLSATQAGYVSRAMEETDRIARTFDALLQIAQIEGGMVRERFVPVDLHSVAETIVDVFIAAAEDGGRHLSFFSEDGPYTVAGDRDLLGQVLANLIENGLTHVPVGGSITVNLSRERRQIILHVTDDGAGIPKAERTNVLRRLYRLEHSRTTPGNGLGLSTVAAICDLHHATLTLQDNQPGLCVSVKFPEG